MKDLKKLVQFRQLRIVLSIAISIVMLSSFSITSKADYSYVALSQYYAALSVQGGNESMSALQALALSQYYMALATGSVNPAGTNTNSSAKPSYAYFDPVSVSVYMSTTAPNCSHKHTYLTRYIKDGRHAVYCPDCYVIFQYDYCRYDNEYYCSKTDYMHNRCLVCYHKYE